MAVIKCIVQQDFTVLHNSVLENPNLSFKAKGLWAYCMSRPQNWQFHVSHLAKVSKEKEDAIYSALKELEKEGIVQKTQSNDKGKFGPVDYIIYPYPPEIQKILPLRDFPRPGNPRPGNPALSNKDLQKESKKKNPPLTPPKEPERRPFSDFDPPPEPDEPPATPEEEEEISFRLKKRKKEAKPIVHLPSYRKEVLKSLRAEKKERLRIMELERKHREEANYFDVRNMKVDDWTITCCKEHVELTYGSHYKAIRYDLPDDEWKAQVPWKRTDA